MPTAIRGSRLETDETSAWTSNAIKMKVQCGPMPNAMAALPHIGDVLCSTPQSLADAQYWSAVQ